MSTVTQVISGTQYEKLMEGVDGETRTIVENCLLFFANDADTSATEEKARSDKLRTAYNALVDFLVSNRLNELNANQTAFLCTGALADSIVVQSSSPRTLELFPSQLYSQLIDNFSKPSNPNAAFSVFSVMDKFTAIAKGELLALTIGDDRKKDLRNSPQDQKRMKDEWKRRMDQLKSEIAMSITQIDIYYPKMISGLNENSLKNAKVGLEMMKKVSAAWARGEAATPQEKALIKAFEGKIGDTAASMSRWMDEIYTYVGKILENSRMIDEKHQGVVKSINEIAKIDNASPVIADSRGPLFNADAISSIRTDIDTTNSVSVRVADASPMKVAYSASRILLNKQFDEDEDFKDRLCTRENILAGLNKVVKIHTNLFPKDFEGRFIVPHILIEPLRNFVDFFQDRFLMSFVSGETVRKGPVMTFNPVDVQVLRLCALYLTKDPIYDYRGDVKAGTFMGDYVGKIDKQTKVKWTGQEKKYTLAVTQSMQDTASREDAVTDYIDFIVAMANGIPTNPKVSKRKINILLKYVLFDRLEKNISGILRLVAQTDPAEAKDSIMFFAKDNIDAAKDMIRAAVKFDPQTSKIFSDNTDFAILRVFGR